MENKCSDCQFFCKEEFCDGVAGLRAYACNAPRPSCPDGSYVFPYSGKDCSAFTHRETPLPESVQTVTEWADSTFGPATLERQVMRALEEIGELQEALRTGDAQKIAIEAADACICLYRVIGTINPKAIDEKMAINRARQWKVDGQGCAQHVGEE